MGSSCAQGPLGTESAHGVNQCLQNAAGVREWPDLNFPDVPTLKVIVGF